MPRRPLRSLGLSIPPPATSRPHAPSRTQNTVKSHAATARETWNPTNCSSCSSSMRELLPPRNSSKTIAPRWSRRSSGSLALNSHQPPQPMTSSPSSLAAIPVTTTLGSLRATLRSVSAARNRPMPSTFHNVERHQRTGMGGASTPSTPSTRTDRCTVRIPDGTDRPRPEDQDLHRVWLSSDIFRNLSQPDLDTFLLDSLTNLWDRVYEATPNDGQPTRPPNDFVTVLNKARQVAEQTDAADLTLGNLDTLYILEYSRATKLGYASPFIMLEYPTSRIPQVS